MRTPALDGRAARTALVAFDHLAVSLLMLLACLPYVAFELLVGWQPSHGALWLGTASLTPVGPAVFATLAAMKDLVDQREYPGNPAARFGRGLARAVRELGRFWVVLAPAELFLAYDAALFGASTGAAVAVGAGVTLLALLVVAVAVGVLEGIRGGLLQVVSRSVAAVAVRPLVPPAWLLLIVTAVLATQLPVIGQTLLLFAPAACASAILVVDASWPRHRAAPV